MGFAGKFDLLIDGGVCGELWRATGLIRVYPEAEHGERSDRGGRIIPSIWLTTWGGPQTLGQKVKYVFLPNPILPNETHASQNSGWLPLQFANY